MKEDNAVFCERCQSKQTAEKSIKFKSFPLILNLQLKRYLLLLIVSVDVMHRFDYDWENNVRVKLNDEIAFTNYMQMNPYLIDPKVLEQAEAEKEENKDKDANVEKKEIPAPPPVYPINEIFYV